MIHRVLLGFAAFLLVSGCEPEQDWTLRPQAKPVQTGQAQVEPWTQPGAPQAAGAAPAAPAPSTAAPAEPGKKLSLTEQMDAGQKVYALICQACHQANGQGLPNVFPPLAKSDYLMADKERSIKVVINGLMGPVTVNGVQYNLVMPPQPQLSNDDIANVLTFVRNSFGNKGDAVTPEEVAKARGG